MNLLSSRLNTSKSEPSLRQAIGPVFSVLLAQAVFIGVSAFVGRLTSPLISLIILAIVGLVGLLVLYATCGRRLFGKPALLIIGIAFLIRLGVGCTHYLTLMEPEYFSNPGSFEYLWDYQWYHESLLKVSGIWQSDGFLAPLPEKYWVENKNAVLLAYCSMGYYFSGEFPLTMAVWNSLHSIYTAFLIGALALHLGANRRQALFALAFLAFQPFGIISSMMVRDFIGQTWLAIAVYLIIVLIKWRALWAVAIPVASLLAMSLRQPYLIIILLGAGFVMVLKNNRQIGVRVAVFTTIAVFVASSQLGALLGGLSVGRFLEGDTFSIGRLLAIPIRLIRGVFGPFPWFQVFDDPAPTGIDFMPVDFLQVVFNLALLLVVVPRIWRRFSLNQTVNLAVPFGIMLYLTGALATGVHQTYISVGMIFLLPEACRASSIVWFKSFGYSIAFFLLANGAYWISGLKGSGLFQDIGGGY